MDCIGKITNKEVFIQLFNSIFEANNARFEQALRLAQNAISLDPDYPESHVHSGTIYMKLSESGINKDRVGKAIIAYKEAIRIQPDNANANFNLGIVYASIGDWYNAVNYWGKAEDNGFIFQPQFISSTSNLSLHAASMVGDIEQAQKFLSGGANINALHKERSFQFTSLHYASAAGKDEMVKFLLENGADVDIQARSLEITSDSVSGEVIKRKWIYAGNPLIYGVRKGKVEIIKMLVNAEADVNTKDTFGATPLIVASRDGDTEIVKMLISAGASVEGKSDFFGTALEIAQKRGHADIVDLLLIEEDKARKNRPWWRKILD